MERSHTRGPSVERAPGRSVADTGGGAHGPGADALDGLTASSGGLAGAVQMAQAAGGNLAMSASFGGGGAVQMSPNTTVGYNATPEGRDPEQADGRLPYRADGGWDHAAILGNLAQADDDPMTEVDGFRCSAVSFLAMHIPGGPSRVAAVASQVETQMQNAVATWVPDILGLREATSSGRVNYMRRMLPLLAGIRQRIGSRRGTYQDLRRLSAAIYAVSDTNEDARGLDGDERAGLARLTPERDVVVSENRRGWGQAEALFRQLETEPNRAALVGISMNGRAPGAAIDHNITVGFDGAIYVFDPMPRAGTQMMRLGSHDAQIRSYFEEDGQPLNWVLERFVAPSRAPGGRAAPGR